MMIEEDLEQLKKTRQTIQEVAEHLKRDADKMAEEAEGKQGSKMAEQSIIQPRWFRTWWSNNTFNETV